MYSGGEFVLYVYNNLKYIREKLHLSKNQFADKLGLNVSNVSRWENSKNGMSLETAYAISQKLDIPLPDLVGKDLSVDNNVVLDETHKLDVLIHDKSKQLSDDGKKALISIIDNIELISKK